MTTSPPTAGRNRWVGLIGISLAVALIIVDSTIVNVAIPSMVRDLSLTSTEVQWVQESYTLVFAATLLMWGALADRYGRRRILITGTALFLIASMLCAVAPTGPLLIGARVIQGVGGAMMLPTTLSLINATFTGRDRGIAFAIWGSTIGGMAAVGPLLGGWLTTSFSWRWAFGINLPIGLAIIALVLLFVPESRGVHTRGVDWLGALLTTVGFGLLAFGLIEGRQYGWWTTIKPLTIGSWSWTASFSPVPAAFLVSAAALITFAVRARRRTRAGRSSLIDPGLFGITSFRNGNVAALIVSLGEFGIILSLPIWLQNVRWATAPCRPAWCSSGSRSGRSPPAACPSGCRPRSARSVWCGSASLPRSSASPGSAWWSPRPPGGRCWSRSCSSTGSASAWPPHS